MNGDAINAAFELLADETDLFLRQPGRWRLGESYGIHVYEQDRPVATFHTVQDAVEAVRAVNAMRAYEEQS